MAAVEESEAVRLILDNTNAFRQAQGLQAQAVSPALEQAAGEFARFMADTGKYGHAADGRQPAERARMHGYDYCIVLENLAYIYRSQELSAPTLAETLVEGWKNRRSTGKTSSIRRPRTPAPASPAATTAATSPCRCSDGRAARQSASA